MTLNLSVPTIENNLAPKITVIGVGGAGGNAVNNMIQSNVEGVDFMIANTDSQALGLSLCERRIQMGFPKPIENRRTFMPDQRPTI